MGESTDYEWKPVTAADRWWELPVGELRHNGNQVVSIVDDPRSLTNQKIVTAMVGFKTYAEVVGKNRPGITRRVPRAKKEGEGFRYATLRVGPAVDFYRWDGKKLQFKFGFEWLRSTKHTTMAGVIDAGGIETDQHGTPIAKAYRYGKFSLSDKTCFFYRSDGKQMWVTVPNGDGWEKSDYFRSFEHMLSAGGIETDSSGTPLEKKAEPEHKEATNMESLHNRIKELEDVLSSAMAIAERDGVGTHWKRFADRIRQLGVGSVTPKTFRILPSDIEENPSLAAQVVASQTRTPLRAENEWPKSSLGELLDALMQHVRRADPEAFHLVDVKRAIDQADAAVEGVTQRLAK